MIPEDFLSTAKYYFGYQQVLGAFLKEYQNQWAPFAT